jgi:uncharacterized SAM-binding protein YcdF (DUF218 family)
VSRVEPHASHYGSWGADCVEASFVTGRYFVWTLLGPSQLILVGLLVGVALLLAGWTRAGRGLASVAGIGLLIFGVLPSSAYLASPLERRFPQPHLPSHVTGIILLSGAERVAASATHGVPQLGMHGDRYVTTLRLATSFPEARIVFTGDALTEPGRGPLGTQTAVAAATLAGLGLDGSRVTFESGSNDTCENAANTRALVRPQPGESWVIVTSAGHMPRTIACFRAAGWPDVIAQPADFQAVPGLGNAGAFRIVNNLTLLDLAVHEWLGLAWYRLQGRTQEFFPGP